MKSKMSIIILIFLLISFICNNSYATTITLEQIVEKFNKSSTVDKHNDLGESVRATNDANSINITVKRNEKTENIKYLLNGNILSIEIDIAEKISMLKLYMTLVLIDSIGQLHGYKEGELMKTLNSDESQNYTLEKEGYEIEKLSETKSKIKMDITKKIPLLDFSNTYIEVSDLQKYKKFIAGDGFCEDSKGNIWFNKNGYDGEHTLLVAEKGKLTENTYKSILSILEVMFENDKVIENFKKNYPNISVGDKEFKGFSIKANPKEKTEIEEHIIPSDSGYEFVRMVIDKQLAISSVTETRQPETETKNPEVETPNKDNIQIQVQNEINVDKLPQTGKETNIFLVGLYIIVFGSFLINIFLIRKKIR